MVRREKKDISDIRVEVLLALLYAGRFIPSAQMSRDLGLVGHVDGVPFLNVVQILQMRHSAAVLRSNVSVTYVVRDGDIIRPPGGTQHRLFDKPSRLAQQSLGRIRQDTKHNLVELLLVNGQILIGTDGVVVVFLWPTRSDLDSDTALASFGDSDDFGVETDLEKNIASDHALYGR